LDPRPSHGVATDLIDEAIKMVGVAEQLQKLGRHAALIVGVPLLNELRARVGGNIQCVVGGWKERQVFESCLRTWDLAAVDEWQKICGGDKAWIQHYKGWLQSVRNDEFAFDIALVWGGNASLVAAVEACGRTAISVQDGPVAWPLPELLTFALSTTPNGMGPVSATPSPLVPLDTYRVQQLLANTGGDSIQFENLEGHWNEEIADLLDVKQRYSRTILYVGERRDSPNFCGRSALEADQIDRLIKACATHGALLLIKPPKAVGYLELNERHWRTLSQRWRGNEHVIELKDFPEGLRPALVASVNAVVSFSAEVLFEAMLFDLPVHHAVPTYFTEDEPLLSLEEFVSGIYSKNVYSDKLAVVRDFVIRKRAVTAHSFFNGDGAEQLLTRLDVWDRSPKVIDQRSGNGRDKVNRDVVRVVQGTSAGNFVRYDDGARGLELENGNRFIVTSGACAGEVETLELRDAGVLLEGWALIKQTRTPSPFFIVQYRTNNFLVAASASERLDMAAKWEDEAIRYCGFQFWLNTRDIDLTALGEIQLFAYHGFGNIDHIRI
jgi:hypothetical protein